MTTSACPDLLRGYLASVERRYNVAEQGDGCRITTPLYLPDNTRLSLAVRQNRAGAFEVTDYGETIDGLYLSGVTIDPEDRQITQIGRRFGVDVTGGEITKTSTTEENLYEAIDDVIHAILDMSYLVYTRSVRKPPTFAAAFEEFLIHRNWDYEHNFEVAGASGDHVFDYAIHGGRIPLLVDTVTATTIAEARQRAMIVALKSYEVHEAEPDEYCIVGLLDDRPNRPHSAAAERVLKPLINYVDEVVLWSDRDRLKDLRAA